MSQFSDYSENKLIDMIRGQAWTLSGSLYIGLASSVADGSVTELTGTGYARVAVTRSLANWAGTQGSGTTIASSGTSHATSNNGVLNWGSAGSAWGTATHVALFDALSSGNLICKSEVPIPMIIGDGDPVSIAAGNVAFSLGASGGCSDYLSNKLIDFIFRGQAFTFPATMYAALTTTAPSNAGGGTEVGGGVGYARKSVVGSLANWAGTQGAGTTAASTGTTGASSNNAAITFVTPTGSWGTVGWVKYMDAPSVGNMLFWAPLASSKTISLGSAAPTFAIGAQTITFA